MPKKENQRRIPFTQVLAALIDDSRLFPASYLHQFSDLEGADLEALKSVWEKVNPDRRHGLLVDLEKLSENDTLVSFDNLAEFALRDNDPRVRRTAVNMLWESKKTNLVPTFIKLVEQDPDYEVRAAATAGLGMFIYLGELEEIPESTLKQVEEILLRTINGSDQVLVRQRALESLGYSSRPEVPDLIRKAFNSGNQAWLISSLFAMGRSADSTWSPEIVRMLNHPETSVQVEAVRSAGELELSSARRTLLALLDDELIDEDVYYEAIWSLSKIGGDDVRETLESLLEETEDESLADYLEQALENLAFTDDIDLSTMMEFQSGDLDHEVNLNQSDSLGFDNEEGNDNEIDEEANLT